MIEASNDVGVIEIESLRHWVDKANLCQMGKAKFAAVKISKEQNRTSVAIVNGYAGLHSHLGKTDVEDFSFILVVDYVEVVDGDWANSFKDLNNKRFIQPEPTIQGIPRTYNVESKGVNMCAPESS